MRDDMEIGLFTQIGWGSLSSLPSINLFRSSVHSIDDRGTQIEGDKGTTPMRLDGVFSRVQDPIEIVRQGRTSKQRGVRAPQSKSIRSAETPGKGNASGPGRRRPALGRRT